MSEKPTIVIYGNCAGEFLSQELRRMPAIAAAYDVHWIRSFSVQEDNPDYGRPQDLTALPRCQILFEQTGNFRADMKQLGGDLAQFPIPAGARRISFPPLFLNTLWPLVAVDPRNKATIRPWRIEGAYPKPMGNRLIIGMMRDERDPEILFERYKTIRLSDHVDLDRLHELTVTKIRALDQGSDIVVGDFIERNFRTVRLFVEQLHPSGPLLRHFCEQAFRHLGLADASVADRLAEIQRRPGLGAFEVPIHPDIIEHFDLVWARGLTYRYFSEGNFTHDEFIHRYIRFEWAEIFYVGWLLARQGRLLEAEAVLREAVKRPRAPATFFQALAAVRQGLGWAEAAAEALAAASAAPPAVMD